MKRETIEAADAFVRRTQGEWSEHDQIELESRLVSDAVYAKEFQGVERSWHSFSAHAEAPEIIDLRESALSWMRHQNIQRWRGNTRRRRWLKVAGTAAAVAVVAIGIQMSPYGYDPHIYKTGVGQKQSVRLDDQSQMVIDAATKVHVEYSETARVVRLLEGQAQFSVAKDPLRPFTVRAGDQAIVALGTVFTVEYVENRLHVATVEGRVAVKQSGSGVPAVELSAGHELTVKQGGRPKVEKEADMAAATAWLEGKVIFRDEPLADAVQRLNRYSPRKLELSDPTLGALRISGVFDTGDIESFARSVEEYYGVVAEFSDGRAINLRSK